MEISKVIALIVFGIFIGAQISKADDWSDFFGNMFGYSLVMVFGYYLLK